MLSATKKLVPLRSELVSMTWEWRGIGLIQDRPWTVLDSHHHSIVSSDACTGKNHEDSDFYIALNSEVAHLHRENIFLLNYLAIRVERPLWGKSENQLRRKFGCSDCGWRRKYSAQISLIDFNTRFCSALPAHMAKLTWPKGCSSISPHWILGCSTALGNFSMTVANKITQPWGRGKTL
jgi:hypothetical protein